jgi:hypothetical protein
MNKSKIPLILTSCLLISIAITVSFWEKAGFKMILSGQEPIMHNLVIIASFLGYIASIGFSFYIRSENKDIKSLLIMLHGFIIVIIFLIFPHGRDQVSVLSFIATITLLSIITILFLYTLIKKIFKKRKP